MTSGSAPKARWAEVRNDRHSLAIINAAAELDRRWDRNHSRGDGSEFAVEGLYSPHLERGAPGVPVPAESLGSTCLTQLAGNVAMVTLPELPPQTSTRRPTALGPPYLHHQWLRDADWSGFVDTSTSWGALRDPDVGHVRAVRVAVAPANSPTPEIGRRVQDALGGWWRNIARWLELLSDHHVRPVDDFHWSDGSAALYTWSPDGEVGDVLSPSWMRSSPRLGSAWATPNYWPVAVQLAGLGEIPPLPCWLLVTARRAFREGEYRTCVADCGTAAEVALRDALATIRQPAGKKATLGPIAEQARNAIHGLVPAVFKRRVVDTRNRVLHKGADIDAETAAHVYNLVERVVCAVHPLAETQQVGLTLTPGSRARQRQGGPSTRR